MNSDNHKSIMYAIGGAWVQGLSQVRYKLGGCFIHQCEARFVAPSPTLPGYSPTWYPVGGVGPLPTTTSLYCSPDGSVTISVPSSPFTQSASHTTRMTSSSTLAAAGEGLCGSSEA